MASGYITSDGKDLDERYLGIAAKAKSAETADVAKTAEEAVGLVNNRFISGTGVIVIIRPSAHQTRTWQAPSDGILGGITVRGTGSDKNPNSFAVNDGPWIGLGWDSGGLPDTASVALILKKDDIVKVKSLYSDPQPYIGGVFFPFVNR